MTPARGRLRFPLPLLLTPSSQFSFKLTSRTAALSTSKYHSFLGPLHVMHSIWKMKGMAGGDTIRLRASDTFEAPSVQFRAIHSVLDFDNLDSTKSIYYPIHFGLVYQWPADLTVWVDKESHIKESNFLLSLPRAPLRRKGGRIFHQLILVTPKPHRTLLGALSHSKSIATAAIIGRTKKIWRTRVDQSLTCVWVFWEPHPRPLGILQAHCLPDAWRRRWSNRWWVPKWDGTETVVSPIPWQPTQGPNDETPRRCGSGLTLCLVKSAHVTAAAENKGCSSTLESHDITK